MPARNTLVQLLALYTDPEGLRATTHSVTDEWTDRQQDSANSRVRLAKNQVYVCRDGPCRLDRVVRIALMCGYGRN